LKPDTPDETLESVDQMASHLAFATELRTPPPELFARLRSRIHTESPRRPVFACARETPDSWEKTPYEGVTVRRLYYDAASGLETVLLRMQPGSTYPAHRHLKTEQCLVMEGDLRAGDAVFKPGDFLTVPRNTTIPVTSTESGNLLLIVTTPEVG